MLLDELRRKNRVDPRWLGGSRGSARTSRRTSATTPAGPAAFQRAATRVDKVSSGQLEKDVVRTEGFTQKLLAALGTDSA